MIGSRTKQALDDRPEKDTSRNELPRLYLEIIRLNIMRWNVIGSCQYFEQVSNIGHINTISLNLMLS
jgi:hypothetical protein